MIDHLYENKAADDLIQFTNSRNQHNKNEFVYKNFSMSK